MFTKMLATCLFLASCYGFAGQLADYQEIQNAISNGKFISLVVDFSKCNIPFCMTATLKPKDILMTNNHITFSNFHFTQHNPKYLGTVFMKTQNIY